jgi:hypothetical protein
LNDRKNTEQPLEIKYLSGSMKIYHIKRIGVPGGGGGSPPSFFGQSGNIRSTVGQFWFEIKKNGTNSVNFG